MACAAGFGSGPWGGAPWGGAVPFAATYAVAQAENRVRVEFSRLLKWSDLLDAGDASDESHYAVVPVEGTVGRDGLPARPVGVVLVRRPPATEDNGRRVDVYLDRPLSPEPAEYVVTATGLLDSLGNPLASPCAGSVRFVGVYRRPVTSNPEDVVRGRDLASRVTPGAGAQGGALATADGDYAVEERAAAAKKRLFRRLTARKGRYLHLPPDWGVGVASYAKRLATTSARNALVEDATRQLSDDPDVERVVVRLVDEGGGTWRIVVVARVRGGGALKIEGDVAALVDVEE